MHLKSFSQTFLPLVFVALISLTSGIVILDEGVPPNQIRAMRGATLDSFDMAQFSSDRESFTEDQNFMELLSQPDIMHISMENFVSNLNGFNQALTSVLAAEAEKITARSALNMCQWSKARMSSLEIMHMLQANQIQFETAKITGENNANELMVAAVKNSEALLNDMMNDLHFLPPTTEEGQEAMNFLMAATTDFTVLQASLAQAQKETEI